MTTLGLCHQLFVLSITRNGLLPRSAISLRPALVGAVIADCQDRGVLSVDRFGHVQPGEWCAGIESGGGDIPDWDDEPLVLRRLVDRIAENPGKSVAYWVEKLSRHVVKHIVTDLTAEGVVATRRCVGIAAGLTGDRFEVIDHALAQQWHAQVRAELQPSGQQGTDSVDLPGGSNQPNDSDPSSVSSDDSQPPVLPWLGLALQDCWRPCRNIPVLCDCAATKHDLTEAVKSYQELNVLFGEVEQVIRSRRATFVSAVAGGPVAAT